VVIEKPIIAGDSLAGNSAVRHDPHPGGTAMPVGPTEPAGIPISTILQVATRESSTPKTLGLVFGVIAGVAAIAGLIFAAECDQAGSACIAAVTGTRPSP
jgi:hypothetical protein